MASTPVLARDDFQNPDPLGGISRLVGETVPDRDAVGARIPAGRRGSDARQMKAPGGSYLSSHDPREVLGLGTAAKLDWVEIQWPKPSVPA
ncbi:MAG: ASPIC/UnbV domain-containing protein [Bryobacterales bacterium]|nr:ASPIC/UnbV domain-containing protein [Bryobacterales bacterium]